MPSTLGPSPLEPDVLRRLIREPERRTEPEESFLRDGPRFGKPLIGRCGRADRPSEASSAIACFGLAFAFAASCFGFGGSSLFVAICTCFLTGGLGAARACSNFPSKGAVSRLTGCAGDCGRGDPARGDRV